MEPVKNLLLEYKNKSASYSFIHKKEYEKLIYRERVLSISSIILVSASTTGNLILENSSFSGNSYLIISYSIVLYFSAFLSGLSQYLGYPQKSEKNKIVSCRYSNLFNKIQRSIITDDVSREIFNKFVEEYDEIFKESPMISDDSIKKFTDDFLTSWTGENEHVLASQPNCNEDIIKKMNDPRIAYELERFINLGTN